MGVDTPEVPQSCYKGDAPGLLYEYSETNAPRNCGVCGEPADYYVFLDNEISESLCSPCLRDAPTKEIDA